MCIFSRPVGEVTGTQIFARFVVPGTQALVYQMRYKSDEPVAMILPVPIKRGSGEKALQFIDLHGYPTLFHNLDQLFTPPLPIPTRSKSAIIEMGASASLEVVRVGNYVASFVPTTADFARLDSCFQMPEIAFDALPHYRDYGFAVFQLDATRGVSQPHPMAFTFPTRDDSRLFFPTVHIHDGAVHPSERFDHVLYGQWSGHTGGFVRRLFIKSPWEKAHIATTDYVTTERTEKIVDGALRVHRNLLKGMLPNSDTWLSPRDLA